LGDLEKIKFCGVVNGLERPSNKTTGITREFYRQNVEIPCQYYLQRDFSIEVLDKFDVGTCKRHGKALYQRAVTPIYDEDGQTILGFTGRSIFQECNKCKHYHDPEKECYYFPKWKHTAGFQKENCLYNYWNAKRSVLETGVIIIVESPGNVWRLEEAGITNSVAIFGTTLNQNQKKIIDESGALSIICILDNDEAGLKGSQKITDQCSKMYRLYFPSLETNDIAEMNVDKITSDIKPIISKIEGTFL
jgi:DNA primase